MADIRDDLQCKNLVENIRKSLIQIEYGLFYHELRDEMIRYEPEIDILINATHYEKEGGLLNTSPFDHDYVIDLNMRINFVIINFFQDMLIASQGCVVSLTNICGSVPDESRISFSMA